MLITLWTQNLECVQKKGLKKLKVNKKFVKEPFLIAGAVLHKLEISFSKDEQHSDETDNNIIRSPAWPA